MCLRKGQGRPPERTRGVTDQPRPQLTSSATASVHVSGASMKTKNAGGSAIYESLNLVNRGFEQIRQELERIQQRDLFRLRAPIRSVTSAVKETHAWVLFEILEVLREHEEDEWTRLGHVRSRQESARPAAPRRRSTSK
jgi:hypothetical protein